MSSTQFSLATSSSTPGTSLQDCAALELEIKALQIARTTTSGIPLFVGQPNTCSTKKAKIEQIFKSLNTIKE